MQPSATSNAAKDYSEKKWAGRNIKKKRDDVQLWQSRVEIKRYSVAYFDRIAAFEVLIHAV